jgi:hypothetical protein
MNILTSGRYLRPSVAYVSRALRRGLPLLEREPDISVLAQDVRWVIVSGAAFAAAVPQDPSEALHDLRPIARRLQAELPGGPPAVRHLGQAAQALTDAMIASAEGHLFRELGNDAQRARFAQAQTAVLASIGDAEDGLFAATDHGLVSAALGADCKAFDKYVAAEDTLLGQSGAWLGNAPPGEDVLGPPLEPSEGGPLGLLWPEQPPDWYRDDAKIPDIVAAHTPRGHLAHQVVAADIAFFSTDRDAAHFETEVTTFLSVVKAAAARRALPRRPQTHVYLPDRLTPTSRAELFHRLTALDATVWRDTDFGTSPGNEGAFVTLLKAHYRKTGGRGQLLALSPAQQLAMRAGNGAVPPIAALPTATPPPMKPSVNDPGWQRQPDKADAYSSIVERSKTAPADG